MSDHLSLGFARLAAGAVRRARLSVVFALLGLSIAAAGPARADMFTPSVKDQIRLGDQAAAQVMRKYRVVNDDRARNVDEVGRRLVDALSPQDRGPWNYRFHLIDSKEINAFALPGGNVFFFTGLYDRLKTEDELAAVLGHELTHVRKEHWAKMAGAQSKREAGLAVILGMAHAGRAWQNVAGLADSMLTLRYSRKDEDQADAGGLQDVVAAGYNPQGMLDMFHVLQQAAGRGEGPAFLADHPLTTTRIQHTQDRINQLDRRSFPPETPLAEARAR